MSMSRAVEPATILGTRILSDGIPKSDARLRTRYCASKNSSMVTSMPSDSTILSTVLISTPGTPPQTSTYSLFSHAAKAFEPHESLMTGLRMEKLYELLESMCASMGGMN